MVRCIAISTSASEATSSLLSLVSYIGIIEYYELLEESFDIVIRDQIYEKVFAKGLSSIDFIEVYHNEFLSFASTKQQIRYYNMLNLLEDSISELEIEIDWIILSEYNVTFINNVDYSSWERYIEYIIDTYIENEYLYIEDLIEALDEQHNNNVENLIIGMIIFLLQLIVTITLVYQAYPVVEEYLRWHNLCGLHAIIKSKSKSRSNRASNKQEDSRSVNSMTPRRKNRTSKYKDNNRVISKKHSRKINSSEDSSDITTLSYSTTVSDSTNND